MHRVSLRVRVTSILAAGLMVVSGLFIGAAPAAAADGALEISKTVNGGQTATLSPGDEFTFQIRVGCDDVDCVNAAATDTLPAEFAGFTLVSTTVTPQDPTAWRLATTGCTGGVVTADPPCTTTLSFIRNLGGGQVGLAAGTSYSLSMTLRVPANLPPTWQYNGQAITNRASAAADNAATQSSQASVTVNVPVSVDTATTKSWSPTTEQFSPGAQSTVALTTQNASNVPASSLVVQEPSTATDGATALDPGNPFLYTDFAGLGAITLPEGATEVRVDAYASDPVTGEYSWVQGDAGPPDDVAVPVPDAAVAGLRVTFLDESGDPVMVPGGAAGGVDIQLAQRQSNRDTGASLEGGWTAANTASGTVTVPGHAPATKDASASHTVTPVTIAVRAGKSFAPDRIPAGEPAVGTITATNASDGPLASLTVSDHDYFTRTLRFTGFSAPPTFPAGSTGAHITWRYGDGSTSTQDFASGDTPAADPPAGSWVTGFDIVFDGPIQQNAAASVPFQVVPDIDFVPDGEGFVTTTNSVDVTGTSGTKTAEDSHDADLSVYAPDIDLQFAKTVLPSTPVAPGGTVVSELRATTSTDSAFVRPTSITVDDTAPSPHQASSLWNAFNPVEIAPTAIPEGSTLTIRYTTDDGDSWQDLTACGPVSNPPAASYSCDIPAALQDQITGLRFVFTNSAGFPQGTTVQPNVSFQARADQRYGGDPTSVPDAGPSDYVNVATAQGQGTVGGETITSSVAEGQDDAQIETHTGQGQLIVGKRWTDPSSFSADLSSVDSQSGEQAGTVLNWGVNSTGFGALTVSDSTVTGDVPAPPSDTVYQAFDLAAIAPITTAQDPLLRWDVVTQIQLYEGGWQTVTPPPGGWMGANGFLGYTLTADQRANTTSVRITVAPNDAARALSTDPTRPAVGSGISASSTARQFDLVWTLRNTLRQPGASGDWVNGSTVYNTVDPGVVDNVVQEDGTLLDGSPVGPATDHDTITILDRAPGVSVTKTTQKDIIPVPNPGDVPGADYPTNDFTVAAHSTSLSRASYVRVTEPMPCGSGAVEDCVSGPDQWSADPYDGYAYNDDNPFERFTLTGLSFGFNASQVDAGASVVTLLHRDSAGTLSTTTTTIAAASTLSADALADVVGVSVVYQGTDPAVTGGTITRDDQLTMTLHTRVRDTLRSDPSTFVTPASVPNFAFAQSYDPVLFASGQGSTPVDTSEADVQLIQGRLDVVASKQFSPPRLLEVNRTAPVTVTLTGTQGPNATVPTNQVTVEDTDASFWNDFALTSFAASDVTPPAGADQVEVDVQLNGSSTWTMGTAGPSAVLPTSDLAAVTGIRFVFSRADGGLFSHTAQPAAFTATAVLHLQLLAAGRDGAAIPFPGTVDDTVSVVSHRTDDPDLYPDSTAAADATFTLDPGTFTLGVAKQPFNGQHTVQAGTSVPWTITFTNRGTGILTVPTVTDNLGPSLEWDGQAPTYATSAGGALSTAVSLDYDRAGGVLTFSWPADGRLMQPGETFTITIGIILKPGLTEGQRALNSVVVHTEQTLSPNGTVAACTNFPSTGQGTVAGLPATDCGSTNFVQPNPGPALMATKGVKGDVVDPLVSGAQNPSDPTLPCVPDSDGYYHAPCVANTRMDGTDEWRVGVTNSGTVPYSVVTIVDPLPFAGDRLLATGSGRGSTFRPVLDGASLVLNASDQAATTLQVSTDPMVCIGDDPGQTQWSTDKSCSDNTWVDVDDYTGSWAAVTGVRAIVDFSDAGGLPPGGNVSVVFRTIDRPASSADADGLPTTVPLGAQYAYNQAGAQATLLGGGLSLAQAPVKVGVTPSTGPLLVHKEITGDDASRAPRQFQADVRCSVGDAALDLGDAAALPLTAAAGYDGRIDGIPVGADCGVAEHGTLGSYGEDARTVSPGSVSIDRPATPEDPAPGAQIVTITNRYDVHPPSAARPGSGDGLAGTGSDVVLPVSAGIGILVAGILLALAGRRRRRGA